MVPLDAGLARTPELTLAMAVERHEFHGSAEELHSLPMPTSGDTGQLWQLRPHGPAVVMGSAQRPEQFNSVRLAEDDIDLAPRRSGGGAVFIAPESVLWVDVVVPRSNDLWSTDLAETFLRTGAIWQQALRSCGIEADMCVTSPKRTEAARLACWAGIGWGELAVDGSKVLGLSQRRTRWGARVQAMLVLDASAQRVADYLVADHQSVVRDGIGGAHLAAVRRARSSLVAIETALLACFAAQTS